MIRLCSSFDQRVLNTLFYGGKLFPFPILNATRFVCEFGGEEKEMFLRGGKYEGKWRNFSKILKE